MKAIVKSVSTEGGTKVVHYDLSKNDVHQYDTGVDDCLLPIGSKIDVSALGICGQACAYCHCNPSFEGMYEGKLCQAYSKETSISTPIPSLQAA